MAFDQTELEVAEILGNIRLIHTSSFAHMAFDQTELKGVETLLRLPRLVHDSKIRSLIPFSWSSKKKRSMRRRRSKRLRSLKAPLSAPKSEIRITIKRKTLENHHQNSGESSKRRKVMIQSSETKSSGPLFRTPDLNLPLLIEGEEQHCPGGISAERKEGISPARSVSPARDEEGRDRCCSTKDRSSDERKDSDM